MINGEGTVSTTVTGVASPAAANAEEVPAEAEVPAAEDAEVPDATGPEMPEATGRKCPTPLTPPPLRSSLRAWRAPRGGSTPPQPTDNSLPTWRA